MSLTRHLHSGWSVSAQPGQDAVPHDLRDRVFEASVPGCIHTDLLAAQAIADPYVDSNELEVAWVGRTAWRYCCTFSWSPGDFERHELVFDGLDTVASITVNGVLLGNTANMHRSYRFDVASLLREGDNELAITFEPAVAFAQAAADRLGALPHVNTDPYNFIRKMACSFGWDWGLSTVTAGIWRPVRLVSWSKARLARVRPTASVQPDGDVPVGRVVIDADVAWTDRTAAGFVLRAQLCGPGIAAVQVEVPAAEAPQAMLEAPGIALWWPHSLGAQPLYDLRVELVDAAGAILDSWCSRIGFRTVEWDTAPDEHGRAFTVSINGQPIFVRGVNWIPDDAFPSRVDRPRYADRLGQARDAHVDLIRVWGGGIYESDDFYDVCNELGLLVWQDFLFACAAYPEDPAYAAEVEAEAREAVARLMPHPSLVLWNGNNENIWGWYDWGWQEQVGDRPWGSGYYLDLLPRVVAETDPSRTYWAGSPYSGSMDVHPNDPDHGPMHIWDVWNERDYTAYRDYVPRFVSEFGYQAPPTWATLTRAVHDEVLAADSPGVLHHQKADDGNGKLARGLAPHLPEPANVDDWHYLTQVNQGRALTLGIEHFRSHRGRCMGTVWWQLNDCWPVTSWAVIDGDARPKPAFYALQRAYADRLLTVQPRGDRLCVILVNDSAQEWVTTIDVLRLSMTGTVLAVQAADVRCGPFATVEVAVDERVARPVDTAAEFLSATAGDRRTTWWFAEDRDLRLPRAELAVSVTRRTGGYDVRISSQVVVKDLCLYADRLHPAAVVNDALVTVMPGGTVELRVECPDQLNQAELASAPVLRCINDVVNSAVVPNMQG